MAIILAVICFLLDFLLQLFKVQNLPVILQPQCLIPLGLAFTAFHLAGFWTRVPWR